MQPTLFLLIAALILGGVVFWLFFYRSWQRRRELSKPFPARWRALLRRQVPHYRYLSPARQRRLQQAVQLFLVEKTFYGCNGFEIDDRVRITIAGHACLLILERSFAHFDDIRSILVYPDLYRVPPSQDDDTTLHEDDDGDIRAGEAWVGGRVILAWSICTEATRDRHHPHNVILHEFAHQLDYLDGSADGAPPLDTALSHDWSRIMSDAWHNLQNTLYHHQPAWLDEYGATEPAEFFAVLTEAFYQQPHDLHHHQPAVYDLLCRYYQLDPRDFSPANV